MFGWILLGIILLIIIVYMIIGLYFHHVMFGKRFSKDPIVKYYDISMFEVVKNSFTFHHVEHELKNHASYLVSSVSECIEKFILGS